MDVHVLLLTAEDPVLETVLHWHLREWSLGTEAERDEWRVRLQARTGTAGIPFTLVARWGDEPVGSISVCTDDVDAEFADRGPWLSGVFVLGPARDLGLGRRLLKRPPIAHCRAARPNSGCTPERLPASTNAAATSWRVQRHRLPGMPCCGVR